MRISDCSSDVCSSDLFTVHPEVRRAALVGVGERGAQRPVLCIELRAGVARDQRPRIADELRHLGDGFVHAARVETFLFHPRFPVDIRHNARSEEHTSELQSLMRISYSVFCLKKKTTKSYNRQQSTAHSAPQRV